MIRITYVTANKHKREENAILLDDCLLGDGRRVGDVFSFDIREVQIREILEVDLETMVKAEARNAYSQIKVPCIVEHAGLIFTRFGDKSYPGGLTKAMWNALEENFVKATNSAGEEATARAVVAYCDGATVRTFVGETKGTLIDPPRGQREFYWDTVFVPSVPQARGRTYAEIVANPALGLRYKVKCLSQSTKAMLSFLEFRLANGPPVLWPD